jgi:hypothetical protein
MWEGGGSIFLSHNILNPFLLTNGNQQVNVSQTKFSESPPSKCLGRGVQYIAAKIFWTPSS